MTNFCHFGKNRQLILILLYYFTIRKLNPLDKATRKDKLEGHHGDAINTQVTPTKKYILSLYLKYLESIIKPTSKEIATKIRENTPFKVSKRLSDIS